MEERNAGLPGPDPAKRGDQTSFKTAITAFAGMSKDEPVHTKIGERDT